MKIVIETYAWDDNQQRHFFWEREKDVQKDLAQTDEITSSTKGQNTNT